MKLNLHVGLWNWLPNSLKKHNRCLQHLVPTRHKTTTEWKLCHYNINEETYIGDVLEQWSSSRVTPLQRSLLTSLILPQMVRRLFYRWGSWKCSSEKTAFNGITSRHEGMVYWTQTQVHRGSGTTGRRLPASSTSRYHWLTSHRFLSTMSAALGTPMPQQSLLQCWKHKYLHAFETVRFRTQPPTTYWNSTDSRPCQNKHGMWC